MWVRWSGYGKVLNTKHKGALYKCALVHFMNSYFLLAILAFVIFFAGILAAVFFLTTTAFTLPFFPFGRCRRAEWAAARRATGTRKGEQDT